MELLLADRMVKVRNMYGLQERNSNAVQYHM